MNSRTDWQQELASCIKDPSVLLEKLNLRDSLNLTHLPREFSCRVPHSFFLKMKKGDINDPLLKQVLPLNEENTITPGYSLDPLQELQANPTRGLLHKYAGRVLMTLTGACAIHCRYCFRRHFPYNNNSFAPSRWQMQLDYLKVNPDVHEVILSGGDPLTMKDSVLQRIINDINHVENVTTLRLHTRLPLVIPSRITDGLCEMLKQSRLRVVMVIHCNHANEIDSVVEGSLQRLQQSGVTLLNQSVILKGINDDAEALTQLSFALHRVGVLPYYLHLPDKTQGTAHFDVTEAHAVDCIQAMRQRLPGYLVPRLAVEIPGDGAKTVIA